MSSLQAELWSTSLLQVKMCSILECGELNLLSMLTLVSIWCTITNILNPYLERKSIHIPQFTAVLLILSTIWKLPKGSSKDEWIKFVCIYLYIHTHIYTHTHTHTLINTYTYIYTHTHTHMYIYTHTHISIYTHNAVLFSLQRNEIFFFVTT